MSAHECEAIVAFIQAEARDRYGAHGKLDVEEALDRIAQLILRGQHLAPK